jgi:hypothetical protein
MYLSSYESKLICKAVRLMLEKGISSLNLHPGFNGQDYIGQMCKCEAEHLFELINRAAEDGFVMTCRYFDLTFLNEKVKTYALVPLLSSYNNGTVIAGIRICKLVNVLPCNKCG